MSIDREKVWEAGQRYLQRGQADKAIVEFERIAADDPSDLRAPLKIGDLELQRGNLEAARRNFLRVADAYLAQGFWSKAGAVLKQLAHVEPNDVEVQTQLAEVYQKQGLATEANDQWLLVGRLHEAAGRRPEAVHALEQVHDVEVGDTTTALAWTELCIKLDRQAEAQQGLLTMVEASRGEDRREQWAALAERLLELDNGQSELACELARFRLGAAEPAQALSCLRLAFRASPQDQTIMQLLADALEALGQTDKAISIYAELCAQARRRGQLRTLERLLGHWLRLAPDQAEPRAELARLQQGAQGPSVRRSIRKADGNDAGQPLSPADIAALVVEAKVFYGYRLVTRARAYLARVLAADPEHAEAAALDAQYERAQQAQKAQKAVAPSKPLASAPADAAAATAEAAPAAAPSKVRLARPVDPPTFTAPQAKPSPLGTEQTLARPSDYFATSGSGAPPVANLPAKTVVLGAAPDQLSATEVAVFDLLGTDEPPGKRSSKGPVALSSTIDGLDVDALDALIAAAQPEEAKDAQGQTVDSALAALRPAADGPSDAKAEQFAAQLQLGLAYRDMDLTDDAVKQFEQVRLHPPLAAEAHRLLGLCLRHKQDHAGAMKAFEAGLAEATASPSQRAQLHRDYASTLQSLGDQSGAEQHLAKAHSLDPAAFT